MLRFVSAKCAGLPSCSGRHAPRSCSNELASCSLHVRMELHTWYVLEYRYWDIDVLLVGSADVENGACRLRAPLLLLPAQSLSGSCALAQKVLSLTLAHASLFLRWCQQGSRSIVR